MSDIREVLCPLCGRPNACALALPPDDRPSECWCVSRRFPASLLAQAGAPSACICERCLDEAAPGDGARPATGEGHADAGEDAS